jgi:transposase
VERASEYRFHPTPAQADLDAAITTLAALSTGEEIADRWLPSSKPCSGCGNLVESSPLDVREWACRCGAVHDRDVDTAGNILAAGLVER